MNTPKHTSHHQRPYYTEISAFLVFLERLQQLTLWQHQIMLLSVALDTINRKPDMLV